MPQPEDALAHCRYYMTLMRDERLQVRVGECVYVTREGSTIDIMTFNNQRSSHLIRDQLDIFRVERLWRKYRFTNCVCLQSIFGVLYVFLSCRISAYFFLMSIE